MPVKRAAFRPPPRPPSVSLEKAKEQGNKADISMNQFKEAKAKFNTEGRPETPVRPGMMHHAGHVVMHRNSELKNLIDFSHTADVSSGKDGAVFWSGSKGHVEPVTGKDGKPTGQTTFVKDQDAMFTAQAFSIATGKKTLEMTEGGKALDGYSGHPNSFGDLKERFAYAKGDDSKSVPGQLWDNMSSRYAAGAQGDKVSVVHAAPASDPYFQSPAYKGNTWNTEEKPVIEGKKMGIEEMFDSNPSLKPHLRDGNNQPV